MARLAVSELTTLRWSLEEDLEHYATAGIGAIGLWRHKLADCGEEKAAELVAQTGMVVSSLQWAGGFTGSEGRSHRESLEDSRHAVRTAVAVKAGCLIVHSGARGIHTRKHARRLFRQALDKLLPVAEDWGVTLAVEPMNGDCGGDFTFLNCLDETLELVSSYESSYLKIALDLYHWGHESWLLDRLAPLAPRLALVQLGDSRQPPTREPDRCQLGDGALPLKDIVERLNAAGYNGFYEVELMGEEIETCDYHDILKRAAHTFRGWSTVDSEA